MDEQTRRQITWVVIISMLLILVVMVGQRRAEMGRMTRILATGSPSQRVRAVRTLVSRQKLPDALEDQPRWVQDNAVTAVKMVGTDRAMAQLISSMHLLDQPVSERAAAYLVSEGERAIGPLVEALQDKDADVRASATAPLIQIGPPTIPSLLKLVDAWDAYVRDGVVAVFAGIGRPVTDKLIMIMKAPDSMHMLMAMGVADPNRKLTDAGFLRAKDTAQRALQTMKVPAIEPIIAQLLTGEDAELRGTACSMLGVIIDQSVDTPIALEDAHKAVAPLLSRLTSDRSWVVRRKAASALGMLQKSGQKEIGVVSTLIAHLKPSIEPQPEVRAAAAEALGKIGAVEAAQPLVHLLMTARQGATQEIAGALERLGVSAIPALTATLTSPDVEVRRVATETLAEIGTTAAAVPLASRLSDPEPVIRRVAANALKGIATAQVVPQLIRALGDSDWQVYHAAGEALAGVGTPAVPHLVAMLAPENPRVNRMAALALQQIGPAAIPALVEALRSQNAHTRRWAAITLGAVGGDVIKPVRQLLEDETAAVSSRAAAAIALGKTGLPAAVDPLIKAARSQHVELRVAALRALAETEAEEATEVLVNALTASSRQVREVAMELLKDWHRGDIDKLLGNLARSKDVDAARRAGIVLAYHASPEANELLGEVLGSMADTATRTKLNEVRPILEQAAQDSSIDAELRRQAIISLGYIGQEQSLKVLEPFLVPTDPFVVPAAKAVAMIGKATYERQRKLAVAQHKTEVATTKSVEQAARLLLEVFTNTSDNQLRLHIAAALCSMGGEPVDVLVKMLNTAPEPLRPWIAAILGAIGKPATEKVLSAYSKTTDAELRTWYAITVQLSGDIQALRMLQLSSTEEQTIDESKVREGEQILRKILAIS